MGFSSQDPDGDSAPLSEINVTPFVDVMLVLLIIFMVAAPMLTVGLPVELPQADAPAMEIAPETPVVTIQADGRVFLVEEEVPIEELTERLRADERLHEEAYVRADGDVPYRVVARVLSAVRAAGIPQTGLVTEPLGSTEP